MRHPDLRLLAIAGPPVIELANLVDACVAAEAGGVTAVQIRAKSAPAARLLELTEALCAALMIPVYVNDRLVSILYADGGPGGRIHGSIEEYQRLVQKLSLALNMLILKMKIRSA